MSIFKTYGDPYNNWFAPNDLEDQYFEWLYNRSIEESESGIKNHETFPMYNCPQDCMEVGHE